MTTIEEIWTYIDADEPFTVFLSDGRAVLDQRSALTRRAEQKGQLGK